MYGILSSYSVRGQGQRALAIAIVLKLAYASGCRILVERLFFLYRRGED